MTGNEARTIGIMRERRGQDAIGAAGVELDHETVGVTGHVGDLAGLEGLVEADAVGADLVEEREVVIGDAEFGEDVGSDVEDDLHAVRVGAGGELGRLALDLIGIPLDRQQAGEDAAKAVCRGALDVCAILLNRRMLRIQGDTPLHTRTSFLTWPASAHTAIVCI